jgi:uncharacterized protein
MNWMPEEESKPKQTVPEEPAAETIVSLTTSRLNSLVIPGALFLAAFAAAEFVTCSVKDYAGIIFYFAILLSLIINSAVNKDKDQRKFWMTLGLVPLIRIASLAIPLAEISEIFWYLLIAVPVLAGIFVVSRVLKLSLENIGLNGNRPLIQIPVALSGVVLGLVDYFIIRPGPLNSQLTLQSTLFPALILIVATGFTEELAFRGVMQRTAIELTSWGWIYIAAVYAVLQIGYGSALHCVFALLVGLFYGWIVKKTGSILGIAFSHGLLCIGLYLILPHLF